MKKLLLFAVCLLLCAGTVHATTLDNSELLEADWAAAGFAAFDAGPLIQPTFDINGTPVGTINSGVASVVIGTTTWYSYFYSINMNSTTNEAIHGFSVNWGSVAPLTFDFGGLSGAADSWYGTALDGWDPTYAGNIIPVGAVYTPSSGVAAWSYFTDGLMKNQDSAWMIALSQLPPTLAPINVIDGGSPESVADVYVPAVPEPLSLFMLGFGLVGVVSLRKRIK